MSRLWWLLCRWTGPGSVAACLMVFACDGGFPSHDCLAAGTAETTRHAPTLHCTCACLISSALTRLQGVRVSGVCCECLVWQTEVCAGEQVHHRKVTHPCSETRVRKTLILHSFITKVFGSITRFICFWDTSTVTPLEQFKADLSKR